jgi:predicted ATP-grasp superfamily ATP-dependent carboligase
LIDHSAPVLVIYRGGQGAVAIARTLGRLGVPVYLIAQTGVKTPVWASRYWTKRVRWDFSRPEPESLAFILEMGAQMEREHGKRAILLTLADWVAIFVERNAEALQQRFVFPVPVRPILTTVLDKWGMFLLAREHAIPTPTTVRPSNLAEIDEFLQTSGFPIVMKAADPFVPHRPPTKLVHSRVELMEDLGGESLAEPLNVVLQEYIPGEVDSVWMCNGYFGADEDVSVVFTGRKLRQVSAAGIASLAVCLPNETVAAQTIRFMRGIGYRGCVGIGYRYDARDGQYKVLDVNARVSGVFRLFAGTNDMDVVRLCYLDLTGQALPATGLQPGRRWLLESDFRSAYTAIREGRLTVSEWLKSLIGVRETHWFALDDPRPFRIWLRSVIRGVDAG